MHTQHACGGKSPRSLPSGRCRVPCTPRKPNTHVPPGAPRASSTLKKSIRPSAYPGPRAPRLSSSRYHRGAPRTARARVQILKEILENKEEMGDTMKASFFSMTEAKYAAGDNIKHTIFDNVETAQVPPPSALTAFAQTCRELLAAESPRRLRGHAWPYVARYGVGTEVDGGRVCGHRCA